MFSMRMRPEIKAGLEILSKQEKLSKSKIIERLVIERLTSKGISLNELTLQRKKQ